MNRLTQFIRASCWAAGTTYSFFIINFLAQILLAHLLSPTYFGIYAFSLALREIITIVLGFANNQTFIHSEGTQADYNAFLKLTAIASGLFFLLALLGASILWVTYGKAYAYMLALICVGQVTLMFGNAFLAPLEKQLQYKQVAFLQSSCNTVGIALAIAMAWMGYGLWSLAAREIIAGLYLFGLAYYIAPMHYQRKLEHITLHTQFRYGLKTSLSRGMEILFYRFPDLVVQFFMGKVALGNFYQARYLCYMPIKVTVPFTQQVLFSYLTMLQKDKTQFATQLFWINYLTSRLLLPIACFIYLFGTKVFILIYGPQWAQAGAFFQYFALFVLFGSLFNSLQSACYSIDKQQYISQAYVLGIATFILGVAMSPAKQYSALAFSLGFVVSYLYVLIRLAYQQISLRIFTLLGKPSILACLVILAAEEQQIWVKLSTWLLFTLLLGLLELKQIRYLISRIKTIREQDTPGEVLHE